MGRKSQVDYQDRLIESIAQSKTKKNLARVLNVSTKTLNSYVKSPEKIPQHIKTKLNNNYNKYNTNIKKLPENLQINNKKHIEHEKEKIRFNTFDKIRYNHKRRIKDLTANYHYEFNVLVETMHTKNKAGDITLEQEWRQFTFRSMDKYESLTHLTMDARNSYQIALDEAILRNGSPPRTVIDMVLLDAIILNINR